MAFNSYHYRYSAGSYLSTFAQSLPVNAPDRNIKSYLQGSTAADYCIEETRGPCNRRWTVIHLCHSMIGFYPSYGDYIPFIEISNTQQSEESSELLTRVHDIFDKEPEPDQLVLITCALRMLENLIYKCLKLSIQNNTPISGSIVQFKSIWSTCSVILFACCRIRPI